MNFFKKYKKIIAFIISAVVILTAAFVFDGTRQSVTDKNDNYNNAPLPQISEKSPEPADRAEPAGNENADTENQTAQPENGTVPDKSDVIREEVHGTDGESGQQSVENPAPLSEKSYETKHETDSNTISETKGTTAKNDVKESACTVSISCASILDNMDMLDMDKADFIPKDGVILKETSVKLEDGESVFDLLVRVTKDNSIHMEFSDTPIYNTKYVEGIANIYELDCGSLSGWQYSVNGVFPNVGCSAYYPESGDVIEWKYTCDLGRDLGNAYTAEDSNG